MQVSDFVFPSVFCYKSHAQSQLFCQLRENDELRSCQKDIFYIAENIFSHNSFYLELVFQKVHDRTVHKRNYFIQLQLVSIFPLCIFNLSIFNLEKQICNAIKVHVF